MVGTIILIIAIVAGYVPVLAMWRRDTKLYGKEEVAVPLLERTVAYLLLLIFPVFVAVAIGMI